ncbi:MAG: isoleucine--tRNA ligase, partial [Deltaproteobacteria bacterium]|nr:isoleucine--tRNA ligase [Deltaproteobacteria bacterium]
HTDLFLPVKEEYKDPGLADRWENILKVRGEVTKALEVARKDKIIGHSLDASVLLGLPDNLLEKINPYKDQLRTIFIVSSVDLVPAEKIETGFESEVIEGLMVQVTSSRDKKCERCWVHEPTVGDDSQHPTTCKRCISALTEMGSIQT